MGLFSLRNFAAPFTNTVNLITIIFIVLLFAVFRLSSGRYQTSSVPETTRNYPVSHQIPDVDAFLSGKNDAKATRVEEPPAPKSDLKPQEIAPRNDLGKEIEALSARVKQSATPKKSETQNGSGNERLQDIEKALGIK